jgi:4-amino-4-deoxy-L-arabinose transferase-like glycosyltransferase
MTDTLVRYIPSYFTKKGISAFLVVIVITSALFLQRILSFQSVLFCVVEAALFFYFSSKLSLKWLNLSTELFSKKLFRTALFVRLIWVLFSYIFYIWMTGKPFEFDAADAPGYHDEAIWLVSLLRTNQFDVYLKYIGIHYDDMGYPFYLGILYYVIGDGILIPRIIKSLLGTFTCLLIYRIARNNFGETTGRIAGIMAMLLPNLIYYCGLHVKETEMIFLVVCFVYLADKLIRSHTLQVKNLVLLAFIGASLFFFRTVLASCLIGSVGVATFITSRRVSALSKRVGLIILLGAGTFFIYSTPLADRIDEYLKASDQNLTSQMDNFATRDGANKLARYGSRGIFLPLMIMAPFPTLINIPDQPNAMMLGGAYFTRNVYAFFVLIGIYALYKRKQLREHILLLSVIFSYIFVLASSGFALSERFHLPLVPFLLILAAYGISQMNAKNKKYYVPYLVLICVIVIGWNWFKVAGRS